MGAAIRKGWPATHILRVCNTLLSPNRKGGEPCSKRSLFETVSYNSFTAQPALLYLAGAFTLCILKPSASLFSCSLVQQGLVASIHGNSCGQTVQIN